MTATKCDKVLSKSRKFFRKIGKCGKTFGKVLLLAAKAPFCYLPQIVLGTGYVGKDLLFQLLLRSKFLFGA